MTEAPNLYHLTLTANAEGAQDAEALRIAAGHGGPFLAMPLTMTSDGGHLTVRFAHVSDEPAAGSTTVKHATPGAEIVSAIAGFSDEPSLTVAVIKALLTFSAIREAAGLRPRERMRIDVVPAPALAQDSLSPQLSDAVPGEFPPFEISDEER